MGKPERALAPSEKYNPYSLIKWKGVRGMDYHTIFIGMQREGFVLYCVYVIIVCNHTSGGV